MDAVINHMAGMSREGVGSGGSSFNTMEEAHDFPAVPYSDKDFTPRSMCPSGCGRKLHIPYRSSTPYISIL